MNEVQKCLADIQDILPGARGNIDAPTVSIGRWFLDVRFEERHVVVEWVPVSGHMGVTRVDVGEHGYGEKPDWVTKNYYRALARVLHLLVIAP